MPINVIEDEQKSVVLEFDGIDRSVAELIARKLLESKSVDFASVEKERLEASKSRLVVKGDKPKAAMQKVLEQLQKEVDEIKDRMPKK
ncbi:MAG: hypothetical protein QW091_01035 [Candidatus Micrarchaeaceae archaeon]